MNLRSLAPPVATALVVLIVGTGIHGSLTDRWGMVRSEQLSEFTQRLVEVPASFGPWEGTDADVDPRQLDRAQVTGHVSRIYRHRDTGEEVSLFLVCGTSRHITLHTPDLCYQGAGFSMEEEPGSYSLDLEFAEPVEFATTRFLKEESTGVEQLRIFWSFSDDGQWLGPRWARTSLAGKDALYKIYLIAPITGRDNYEPQDSPCVAFAKLAMPQLQNILFAPRASEG